MSNQGYVERAVRILQADLWENREVYQVTPPAAVGDLVPKLGTHRSAGAVCEECSKLLRVEELVRGILVRRKGSSYAGRVAYYVHADCFRGTKRPRTPRGGA